jgi:hypothetical protein
METPVLPPKPKKRTYTASRPTEKRTRWTGMRPMYDYWGAEIPRFYNVETLASATERLINTTDTFIVPSVKDVLGPAPVTHLAFELFQEGQYQLIFRLNAGNARRKRASFGFVVAKNAAELSKIALSEHQNLRVLFERIPKHVVKPFKGGEIFLPDRHGRREHHRQVYAYLTQWLGTFHELGVTKNLQFYINVKNPITLTVAQTEQLKALMVEIIAGSYNPQKRDCMEMPQIASGDFVVTKPGKGDLKLRLIACRRMLKNVRPSQLIEKIVTARWPWGQQELRLAPADPEQTLRAFQRAWGTSQTKLWLDAYRNDIERGRMREQDALPLEAIKMVTG